MCLQLTGTANGIATTLRSGWLPWGTVAMLWEKQFWEWVLEYYSQIISHWQNNANRLISCLAENFSIFLSQVFFRLSSSMSSTRRMFLSGFMLMVFSNSASYNIFSISFKTDLIEIPPFFLHLFWELPSFWDSSLMFTSVRNFQLNW